VRYSIFSLARNAFSYHQRWGQMWRSPESWPHSQDLNFNVMFSQRGVINLAHSDARIDAFNRP